MLALLGALAFYLSWWESGWSNPKQTHRASSSPHRFWWGWPLSRRPCVRASRAHEPRVPAVTPRGRAPASHLTPHSSPTPAPAPPASRRLLFHHHPHPPLPGQVNLFLLPTTFKRSYFPTTFTATTRALHCTGRLLRGKFILLLRLGVFAEEAKLLPSSSSCPWRPRRRRRRRRRTCCTAVASAVCLVSRRRCRAVGAGAHPPRPRRRHGAQALRLRPAPRSRSRTRTPNDISSTVRPIASLLNQSDLPCSYTCFVSLRLWRLCWCGLCVCD